MTALTTSEINQLVSLIAKSDREDISEIIRFVKDRQNMLARIAQIQFHRGSKVFFKSKKGYVVKGTVEKVMQKNIRVVTTEAVAGYPAGTKWTVHPSLLKAA